MENFKNKILSLRSEGKTYNEISELLNCSKSTISYHCKKLYNNNEINKKNTKLSNLKKLKKIPHIDFGEDITDDIFKKVIEYRINGNTYEEIIEKTKLSIDKIKKICRLNNINDGNYKNKNFSSVYENFTNDDIIEMQKYYDECKSLRKVSKKFNIGRYQISKILIINKKEKISKEEYKEKRKNDIVNNVINWRKDKKRKLVEYKGGCCEKCGYDKCIDAFDFHHMDPNQKDFGISAKSYSFERLKKEVDKCILVCKNCHAELHYEIKNKNGSGA
jgi:DNA invertase Pin-like site-specific DNA recombinase